MTRIKSNWKENLPDPLSNDEVVAYIYKTNDYDKFDSTDYNRDVSDAHVDKLKASFGFKDLGIASPVKTNEKGEVIDGGHTLEARKQGNFPLFHVIIPGTSAEEDIARLNMTRKAWSYEDWIEHYITRHHHSEDKVRFVNYMMFNEFRDKHKFSMGVQLNLFTLNNNDKTVYSQIKAGTLAHPDPDESEHRATWLGYAAEITKDKKREFANAMLFVYSDENIDNDHFLGKLEEKKEKIAAYKKTTQDWIAWFDEHVLDGNFLRNKAFTGSKDGFYFRKKWKDYQDKSKFNNRLKEIGKNKKKIEITVEETQE